LKFLLKVEPKNPDPYYGLLAVEEAEKSYDKIIEYGEEFLKRIEYVEKNPQEFSWTITAIKYTPMAHTLLALAYLRKKDLKNFRRHFEKIFDRSKLTSGEVERLANAILKTVVEVDDEVFAEIVGELEALLAILKEFGVAINVIDIVERIVKLKLKFNVDLLRPFLKGHFGELLFERLKDGKDKLIEYIFGKNEEEWGQKIEQLGLEALIFFYENVPNDNVSKLRVLSRLRKSENQVIKGVTYGLIADTYLAKANFKLALEYYKSAAEVLPEISRFIKPILDDLKTKT